MTTNSPRQSAVTPIPCRNDLIATESIFQGERSWILKDPIALKYYQLKEPEFRIFQLLQQSKTVAEIRRTISLEFPQVRPTKEEIQNLIMSFQGSGLLHSEYAGHALPLREKRQKESRQKAIGQLSNLISIRFPGVDPDRFLTWLYRRIGFLFGPVATCFFFVLIAAAGLLILGNLELVLTKLPEFSQFFGLKNMVYLGVTLILTKSIHELGHGLMCKHFGSECHEIGFMLLVLTPAMYCNTSDSWIMPNKWHRMAIGAAGMFVEVILAAGCTFVWWFTVPGTIHFFALNIMFLCSVSTLIFNANPLLRYDGYFILSDYLEIPNLSQKANRSLINFCRTKCLGMKPMNARLLPAKNRVVFAVFSVASFVYRWFVMFSIFWFIGTALEPYGLQFLGQLMIVISLFGMLGIPMFKFMKFLVYPGRFREFKMFRIAATLVGSGLGLALICLWPISHDVWGSFRLTPADAQYVFVLQTGKIKELRVRPGDSVEVGDVIAILENIDLETEVVKLESELARLNSEFDSYRLLQGSFAGAERMIGQTNAEIVRVKKQIELRNQQIAQLTLVADRSGIIIPPPNIPDRPMIEGQPERMTGTVFDLENRAAVLSEQTLLCLIGKPEVFEATVAIPESDIELVKIGQSVRLLCRQMRDESFRGVISSVSIRELKSLPREISKTNGGFIAAQPQADGTETPIVKMYEATIQLGKNPNLNSGFFGQAKIRVGKTPLGKRAYRYVVGLINFR